MREERRRGTLEAMEYAASLGVTTHIDQGAFQAINTPIDGAAHEDNFTMHLPFLAMYEQGLGTVRLRINFLHMDADPATARLEHRLKNAFPSSATTWCDRRHRRVHRPGPGPTLLEAARRVAAAGWRAEVHSPAETTSATEIEGFEAVGRRAPDPRPALGRRPRPVITQD